MALPPSLAGRGHRAGAPHPSGRGHGPPLSLSAVPGTRRNLWPWFQERVPRDRGEMRPPVDRAQPGTDGWPPAPCARQGPSAAGAAAQGPGEGPARPSPPQPAPARNSCPEAEQRLLPTLHTARHSWRDGGWGASERGEGGARGAIKPFTKIILPRNGVSSRQGGARAESSLADPRSGSCGDSVPATTTRDPRPQLCPQAAPSLQQRRSPCC